MADVAGMLQEYDSMYSAMSKATHGSALLEHLFIQDNRLTTSPYLKKVGLIVSLDFLFKMDTMF
ncbi:hypothetical protein CV093_04030 [Oceanobacillus sp. 143]|nr:hypothetical protein CV093_04030 [Oceanobacillus sp. 143]